uniref:Uncharacterized protein n=1 Tax=Schizaphis graminum TaxID=13262 RepID=A0A2S2PSQ4_SCHGA
MYIQVIFALSSSVYFKTIVRHMGERRRSVIVVSPEQHINEYWQLVYLVNGRRVGCTTTTLFFRAYRNPLKSPSLPPPLLVGYRVTSVAGVKTVGPRCGGGGGRRRTHRGG